MRQPGLVQQLVENRDVILGFILALAQDYYLAEEVFQNVSLAIVDQANKGADVAEFMPWARAIARRMLAEHYRKMGKLRAAERPLGAVAEVIDQAFEENRISGEANAVRQKHLRECFDRLTSRSKELVKGYYHNGRSIRDMAALLGWSEGSVKVGLARARKALAECVERRLRNAEAG
jgi:RNA polymerase sigma-70 factor (ECF subfamily)